MRKLRKFLSAPYWVHLLVDTIIGQLIWWGFSKLLGTSILIRSIIAGAVLIATIFAVALYLPKLSPKKKQEATSPEESDWTAKIVDSAIIGSGFEFFPSRDVLSHHHSLTERISSVSTIWALWPAGTHATGVINAIQTGNIRRLILPYPSDSTIKSLASLVRGQPEDIFNDIKRTANKALTKRNEQDIKQDVPKEERVEVRWYYGMITNSITLGNPKPLSKDSWIQVENLIPSATENRSSYSLDYEATPFKNLFTTVISDYEQLWHNSKPIKESDLHPPSEGSLSQEQVADRKVFIRQLQAIAEQLCKNIQGANTDSITSILRGICNETPVREYNVEDSLSNQTCHLLTDQLDNLFSQASNYQREVKELSLHNLDDARVNSLCNTTRQLTLDYRKAVDAVMTMLGNLESKGLEPIWNNPPWSMRIHRRLADNYDELMRLLRDFKRVTPDNTRDFLPKDDETSNFPRVSLLS